MRSGRLALLAVTTAYVVALVRAGTVLPDRVPSHFDALGRVDGWSSLTSMLVLWTVLGVMVLLGLPLLIRLVLSGEATWVNLPHGTKEYWLAPERRAEFRSRFQDDMERLTALTGLLLVALLVVTTWVGTTGRDAAPGWLLPVLVGTYLVVTVIWTLALVRSYRPPPTAGRA